jgi:hypothetical protein
MVYDEGMTDVVKTLNHDEFEYGDIVRLSQAIRNTKGKRFKFMGACFDADAPDTPLYYELIEIGKGQMRSIRPEHVTKDVAATKDARARIAARLAKRESESKS